MEEVVEVVVVEVLVVETEGPKSQRNECMRDLKDNLKGEVGLMKDHQNQGILLHQQCLPK